VIGARTCIGAGVVVQAQQGTLILEEGVNLGAGVLVIGRGVVGAHTCVGADSTLLNPEIGKSEVLPTGTLLGDQSRSLASAPEPSPTANGKAAQHGAAAHQSQPPPAVSETNGAQVPTEGSSSLSGAGTVYGREQITGLIQTLFPHRQPLSTANSENNS
jgi:carbon dioxide concentrating mechanism protein CcmN